MAQAAGRGRGARAAEELARQKPPAGDTGASRASCPARGTGRGGDDPPDPGSRRPRPSAATGVAGMAAAPDSPGICHPAPAISCMRAPCCSSACMAQQSALPNFSHRSLGSSNRTRRVEAAESLTRASEVCWTSVMQLPLRLRESGLKSGQQPGSASRAGVNCRQRCQQ
jgi:hypothetical protein